MSRRFSLILSLGVALPFVSAPAQESPVQRGSIQLAGTAAFTQSRDIGNDFSWTTLELAPRIGYFVVRGLAVNGNLRYRRIWYDETAVLRNQTFTDWAVGPGLTYYVTTKSPRFFPFASVRTLYGRTVQKVDVFRLPDDPDPTEDDRRTKTQTRTWLASAGALYMVVKHVGITGELFYQRTRATVTADESSSANSAEVYGVQWGVAAFVF